MGFFNKLLKSWWIILSFIPFLNGLGFMYLGFRTSNKIWVLEGIIYEIPWIFSFISVYNQSLTYNIVLVGVVLMIMSIIRSFWVGALFFKAYGE